MLQGRATRTFEARGTSPRSAGYHRQDPDDMLPEVAEVLLQEGHRGLVGDFAIRLEHVGRIVNIGLGGGHLTGVAETEHPTQTLLGHGGADRTNRRPDHACWDVVERVLAPGS